MNSYLGTTSYAITFDSNYDVLSVNAAKTTTNNGRLITYYFFKLSFLYSVLNFILVYLY